MGYSGFVPRDRSRVGEMEAPRSISCAYSTWRFVILREVSIGENVHD